VERSLENECQLLIQKGYSRLKFQEEIISLEDLVEDKVQLEKLAKKPAEIAILIDRLVSKKDDEETQFRVGDSVQTAYFEGEGVCWIEIEGT
jgi:excinuclease ABC subunit A